MRAQVRVIERAIALIGSTQLADALGVWWSDVDRWRRGRARMPQQLLDRAAALIIEKYQGLPWTGAEAGERAQRYG